MRTLKNIIAAIAIALMVAPSTAKAQNCADFLNFYKAETPWRYNTASKSATCFTGKKYEFVLPLTKGNEYRIKFFASPSFNNAVQVKIVDLNSNQTVIDLPGAVDGEAKKGNTCLQDYMDPKTNRATHPYFDFIPSSSTSIKIMIEIKDHIEYREEAVLDSDGFPTGEVKKVPVIPEGGPEIVKGCFTVYVMDKPAEQSDF
ncbi:MAG: hypothetical protein IKQ46_13055 [Bacteroidales bacterium]|jgi:hypothetical protein|nr:hypothetical protein [Bacteroidales bacterium]